MGLRGEIFSTRAVVEGRTYFFNVKENRMGDLFLAIVESKPGEGESFDRRSIVVFREGMDGFLTSFRKALDAMDKASSAKAKRPRKAQADSEASAEAPKKPMEPKPGRRVLRASKAGAARPAPKTQETDAKPKSRRMSVRTSKPTTDGRS